MRRAVLLLLLALPVLPGASQAPDPGPVTEVVDGAVGDVVAPAQRALGNATGQNLSQEDVRLFLNMTFTKGDVDLLGLVLGSGEAEVQASIAFRAEMRVVSSDRVRATAEGENAYNMSAENATALSEVYLTSEMFRATLSAEAIAAFEEEQGQALAEMLESTVPELEVLRMDLAWDHTSPVETLGDTSLTEPPLVLEIDAVVRYLRTESVPSLLASYMERRSAPEDPKKAYIERLKAENGDTLHARDFFAAAAYTQLLNLTMQPGWTLDAVLQLPRGYSFTYFNENVHVEGDGTARFRVDGDGTQDGPPEVILASITHKRAVALVLFVAVVVLGLLLSLPGRFLYERYRIPRLAAMEGDG